MKLTDGIFDKQVKTDPVCVVLKQNFYKMKKFSNVNFQKCINDRPTKELKKHRQYEILPSTINDLQNIKSDDK